MTTASTSTTVLARIIRYGAVLAAAIAALGSIAGWFADGSRGVLGALIGAAIAFVFTAVTAASIILATRVTGGDVLNPAYFGIVLGGWVLKFAVFIVLVILLRDQQWVNTVVLFLAIVVSVLGSLVIDVIVVARSRVPYVDAALPGDQRG